MDIETEPEGPLEKIYKIVQDLHSSDIQTVSSETTLLVD
jgi:hypothetical protein